MGLVVLGIGASSCAGSTSDFDPMKFPVPSCERYVVYDVDPRFEQDMQLAIVQAADSWSRATGFRHCFVRAYPPVDLHFVFVRGAQEMCESTHASGCEHHVGYYYERRSTIYIRDDVAYRRWALAAHEIGHMLRLEHSEIDPTVMHTNIPDVLDKVSQSDELPLPDRLAYCRKWDCY